jgi:hypothetical protein
MPMRSHIEPLESRQLLSTVPAVAALESAAAGTLADYNALETTSHANFASIESELGSAGELKASKHALSALGTHATAASKAVLNDLKKTGTVLKADVTKLETAAAHLAKKPTSSFLQRAESAAVTKLRADAASHLNTITSAITNVANVDDLYAGKIIALNESDANLKAVFKTAGGKSSAGRATLSAATTVTLTTDVQNVIAALTALPM